MITENARLDEQVAIIQATAIGALTGAAGDGAYVSMKGFQKATILIDVTNATTVTGGAVTLKQANNVAGLNEKALGFTRMLSNIDVAASQAKVETAVAGNTFTTDATNSKRLQYILEVSADQLDADNGFDCLRVDVAGMANANASVSMLLWGARYPGISATSN